VRERFHITLVVGIVLVALFFRVWQLWGIDSRPPGLFSDEAMNGNNVFEAINTGNFKIFYPENNGREGLFINLQAISVMLLGRTSFALRIVAALFGVLTVLGIYLFTKEYLRDSRAALLASSLTAISLWPIMLSRLGFRANMAPFFLTAGLWLLYATWNRRNDAHHNRVLIAACIGGLLFGLGFHSYIAYRAAPIILAAPFLLFVQSAWKERNHCIICIPTLFLFFTFIATTPLLYFFLQNPEDFFGRTAQISVFESPDPVAAFAKNIGITLQMFYFAGDYNARHNLPGTPQLWWPVAIFFTLGIVEAFRKKYMVLLLWFFAMMLPVAVSNEGLPHALRAIIMIPPVFILAGIGMSALWKYASRKITAPVASAAGILVLIALGYTTYHQYFKQWEAKEAFGGDLYRIGLFLNDAPEEVPKYVITDEVDSIDRTGRPMALQAILFTTGTYLPTPLGHRNIHYVTANQIDQVDCKTDCMVVPISNPHRILSLIQKRYPNVIFDRSIEHDHQLFVARPK